MRLIDVYEHVNCLEILWDLLKEREPYQNISHRAMPSWDEHVSHVAGRPHADWCLIEDVVGVEGTFIVGAIYLTMANEIGIGIFRQWARRGFGQHAVRCMMAKHGPRRYLANVAPGNVPSKDMFEGLGFVHVQNTYALECA